MKHLLFTAAALFIFNAVIANPVTKQQAHLKALSFLYSAKSGARAESTNNDIQAADSTSAYYVFNVGQDNGFVIVSADDRSEEILGYTDCGNFDAANMPEALKAILQNYTNETNALSDNETVCNAKSASKSSENTIAKNAISPMIETNWYQSKPYNNKCPYIGSTRTIVGCEAVAIAQIVNYNRWPQDSTVFIPGYKKGNATVSDLPPYKFDWDAMEYGSDELATFMLYCGAACSTTYGTSASYSYTNDAVVALAKYFKYDEHLRMINRNAYTVEEWDDIIYNELKEGRPVLYSGSSYLGGGHAFVCDGYDGNGLYHLNFGWGMTSYNGFFRLQTCKSPGQSYGYSFDQDAIIGIQPPVDNGEVEPEENVVLTNKSLTITNGTSFTRTSSTENFTNIKVRDIVYNLNSNDYNFDFGLGLYQNDTLVSKIQNYENSSCRSGGRFDNTYTFSLGANLALGTYRIYPISRKTGTETWLVSANTSENYIDVDIAETAMNLTLVEPKLSITIDSVDAGCVLEYYNAVLKVYLTNKDTEYNGDLYFFRGSTLVKGEHIPEIANTSDCIEIPYTQPKAGSYVLRLTTDALGQNVIFSQPLTVYELTTTSGTVSLSSTMEQGVVNTVLGNSVTLNTKIENKTDEVAANRLYLSCSKGGSWYTYIEVVVLQPKESRTLQFEIDDLPYNKKCQFYMQFGSNYSNTYYFTAIDNVYYTKADGTRDSISLADNGVVVPSDAVSVDFANASIENITPSSNPNCLYYFNEGVTVPEVLASKNVIVGDVAENIVLNDSADFYAPKAFTATNISYSRTFEKGTDGNGEAWSTIVLPFDVTNITVDGQETLSDGTDITWFQNNTDYRGVFWLKDFTGDVNSNVTFKYADSFDAYKPYLICIPGNIFGNKWNMEGKEFVFHGENAEIGVDTIAQIKGTSLNFVGSTVTAEKNNILVLNEEGTSLVKCDTIISPFRAYFESINANGAEEDFDVAPSTVATNINIHKAVSETDSPDDIVNIYNINGVKVKTTTNSELSISLNNLNAGIYVVNGKKIVIR